MDFDQRPIDLAQAAGNWLLIVIAFSLICLFIALAVSMLAAGLKGPGMVAEVLFRGLRDLASMSLRRIGAMTQLVFRESLRKKTLWILAVFILLFMFGHWFLASQAVESAAKRHVVFVMTAVKWLLVPVAVILSCWGLPADIKERSLHTVMTKPTRRSEVVLGRILGYSGVLLLMLLVMSVLGYVWILRAVPERARNQLIARVPVYGELDFIDRVGKPAPIGINVGDIWEFRSFIEGMTAARAVYKFDVSGFQGREPETLDIEYNFEAFRTHKGIMGENVRFSLHFVNPTKDLDVKFPRSSTPIFEFSADPEKRVLHVPREFDTRNSDIRITGERGAAGNVEPPKQLDLWKDLVSNNILQVQVSCDDSGQYLGMARPDMFFRLPDRSFFGAYVKTVLGYALMLVLICTLGVTASTFVKGPVATLLVGAYLMMGQLMRGLFDDQLTQFQDKGRPLGGGLLESIYRILTQDNQMTELPVNAFTTSIQWIDNKILQWLGAMHNIIPDFRLFDGTPYLANGFDIPWSVRSLSAIAITLGFFIPCVVIGTYSLMVRELEAK
ncbi:MAG: hypothetical protein ACK5Q5_01950 [Planctomycetaceae bacterium]